MLELPVVPRRYISAEFGEAFKIDEALLRVREDIGLTNVESQSLRAYPWSPGKRVTGVAGRNGSARREQPPQLWS